MSDLETIRKKRDRLDATCRRKTEQLAKARAARDAAIRELATWSAKAGEERARADRIEKELAEQRTCTEALGQALAEIQGRGVIERIINRPPQIAVAMSDDGRSVRQ